jgi:hypothetical protein
MYRFMLYWLVFIASGQWELPIVSGIIATLVLLHFIYWSTAIVAGGVVLFIVRCIQVAVVMRRP